MKSEWKRAMKLMWGHSERFRFECGCSIILIVCFLVQAYMDEWFFFDARNLRHFMRRQGSLNIGTAGAMIFFFYTLYGNGKKALYWTSKWVRSSKLAKCILVDCMMINRLLVFCVMFLPCLVSRITLIGMGYREYARIELFLLAWGMVYLVAALGHLSEWTYLIGFAIYMVSLLRVELWNFASGIHVSTTGAVIVFMLCVLGGVWLEKAILERGYNSRKAQSKSFWYKELGGNKKNGQ